MVQPTGAGTPGEQVEAAFRTPWQLFWRRFRSDRLALFGVYFIVFDVVVAIAAPLIVKAFVPRVILSSVPYRLP
jgi:ABC-type antimicrobial peptide transport system permease subunit